MGANNQWTNRIEIKSESSNRIYVVSQHAIKRYWACSCPGWKAHRKCKHLERLGLPCGEVPFEVEKEHAMKKGFIDGYKTYDASAGHGSTAEWQKLFAKKMGLDEARQALGLPADAGWEAICQALRLAATESMARLVGDYQAAARAFDTAGPVEEKAQAVKSAKFRLEAYVAYLEEQRHKLEDEAERITSDLLTRIRASA
jgi:hypothetical protein